MRFHVYRLYREDGLLLYIGYTSNLRSRMRDHDRAWYGHNISHVSVEPFATKREAMGHETRLINLHRPPWNLTALPLVFIA